MRRVHDPVRRHAPAAAGAVACLAVTAMVMAKSNIKDAFFAVYPDAFGTTIETVPSQPNHCGVCHYDFTGGGTRNLYGQRLEQVLPDFPNNPNGREQAVLSIENE
ncbi:MAG: hypothetical protein JSV91_14595, partial [Phycisphaerales bacterium]